MIYELAHLSCADYFEKIYCENFSFPPHMHNCFEFVVCLSGKTYITIDEKTYELKTGESVLIFPHQLHSFTYSESRHMICIFSPKTVSAYFNPLSTQKPKSNKFVLDGALITALDKYKCDSQRLFEKGILYLICNEFDSIAEYEENINKGLLDKIFLFINENFAANCSLTTIAKHIGYNASYISRYFKSCVGISLCDYVNIVRLGNVCYLLENSNDTILNCALNSGFDSLRTFNRNFKKFYGVSPKEYFNAKKQHR
ncbi:MAG: helix-turn-helix domain-containing protein [Clostridia bacterium]|nr:helix-turn-helix domain-containing protein [Clostridia bacterium]